MEEKQLRSMQLFRLMDRMRRAWTVFTPKPEISKSQFGTLLAVSYTHLTTKRGNHGHGLKRINNTVEKYGGFINRKNEPGVFATEIMLPL